MDAAIKPKRLSDGSTAYNLEITDDNGDTISMPCVSTRPAVIRDHIETLRQIIENFTCTTLDIVD